MQDFSSILLKWNRESNARQMPWKGEKDPYKIWLSEIILQQTRVEQGLNYYNNFVRAFPDVHKLANAPEEKVFKLWEGLGYYSRCRNLLVSARQISRELNGRFPGTYEEIKSLKGVGPYTAAAISSFAFDLPHAVVDGNVFRVLARIFGIRTPIDSTQGKKQFTSLANQLLDKKQPGIYNQAIMDFGAIICKPVPLCSQCPFQSNCHAFRHDMTDQLPVKEKKTTIRKRWFYYLILKYDGRVAIRQRTGKDIWQQLYEFPLIETATAQDVKLVLRQAEKDGWVNEKKYEMIAVSGIQKQQLSHQLINGRFIQLKLKNKPPVNGWEWLPENKLKKFAFPRFINAYLHSS